MKWLFSKYGEFEGKSNGNYKSEIKKSKYLLICFSDNALHLWYISLVLFIACIEYKQPKKPRIVNKSKGYILNN